MVLCDINITEINKFGLFAHSFIVLKQRQVFYIIIYVQYYYHEKKSFSIRRLFSNRRISLKYRIRICA